MSEQPEREQRETKRRRDAAAERAKPTRIEQEPWTDMSPEGKIWRDKDVDEARKDIDRD